jgi:hypothetical protein
VHRAPRKRGEDEGPDFAPTDRLPPGSAATEEFAERGRGITGAVTRVAMVATFWGVMMRVFEHFLNAFHGMERYVARHHDIS